MIDSQPPAGERLERGRTVTLRVSRGPRPVTVPDLRGKPRSAAEQQLEDLGLESEVQREVSEDQDPGLVLSTDPPPGGSVARGGTVVLVVSRAPEREPVPDVTELDAEDAVREIEDAGFRVRESERAVTDPAQDGVVLEQRPAAGERRTRGARVTIVIGRLQTPAGQPTPTPTPAATP